MRKVGKLFFPLPPGKNNAILLALQFNSTVRAKFLVFPNHFHERCLSCSTISAQDRDVSAYFKIELDFSVLYNDPICSCHKKSSHIKPRNGDKFPHGVNDLIGVQDTNGKCSISKIHEMPKIDGNIPIFRNF